MHVLVMALVLGATLSAAPPAAEEPVRRPNILLVLADDVGVDRVAAYGSHPEPARTPVLDDLARNGVLFRRAWAHPVCSSARSAVLTGRQGFRTGIGTSIPFVATGPIIGQGGTWGLDPAAEESLARVLGARGYRTAAVGKWHLANTLTGGFDHPVAMGFERHLGPISVAGYYTWTKNVADAGGHEQVEVDHYATSEFVDDALEVIEDFGGDPWFVWLAFTAAHTPYHVPPLELLSDETVAEVTGDEVDAAAMHRAAVEAMDTELGRLLAGMAPETLARTVVVFLGDNGTPADAQAEPVVAAGGKGSIFEGGIHVPLLAAGAGVGEPGREVSHLVAGVDLFTTLLDLAGAPLPAVTLDGVSFAPVLSRSDAAPARRWVFSERFLPNGFLFREKDKRALRDERYKLVWTLAPATEPTLRFYDLLLDPLEQTNLVADDQPTLVADQQLAFDRLWAKLQELQ